MLHLLFVSCLISHSLANNIDIEVSPIIKHGSKDSYFGFSLTGVVGNAIDPWVAVGSPKANTSKMNQNETGALYKCPLKMDQRDCEDITSAIFSSSSTEKPDFKNGWYGVSVTAGQKTDGEIRVLVCSHRTTVTYCTSIGECSRGLPGGCQLLNKRGSFKEELLAIDDKNIADRQNGKLNYEESQFGQTGISSIEANAIFYSGAVGESEWKGAITSQQIYDSGNQTYSYLGYSLASGVFFDKGTIAYAAGAPRYNLKGAVFLYKDLEPKPKTKPAHDVIYGIDYGSYFGMAMCSSDFDGDGFSEIVVGAPYFSESLNQPAGGAVYVYHYKNNFDSPVRILKSPRPQARALFGRSVASLGDVDLNGFNDLAVGAPYDGKGGAIYIYHGSKVGLFPKPVQTIYASDLPYQLKTFGWSIRGETDLDDNGFTDIVVGCYASDSIMILRSLPVVEVSNRYVLSPSTIVVSNKTCSVDDQGKTIKTVCFDVEIFASYKDRANKMKDPINLSFQLVADTLVDVPSERRVRFEESGSSVLNIRNETVYNGSETTIVKARAYLRTDQCPDCEDKIVPYPDISFELTHLLPERAKPGKIPKTGNLPSLNDYFQLPYYTRADDFNNVTKKKLLVKRECDPCIPNLKIENIGTSKIPVKAASVDLEIRISNTGDKAYDAHLHVVLPSPLSGRPCDTADKCIWKNCNRLKNATVLNCKLPKELGKVSKEYIITVDTSPASRSFTGDLTYLITMNVSSANPEKPELLYDNEVVANLTVESTADIGISSSDSTSSLKYGGTVRGQYSMTSEEQIGLKLKHRYTIENNGPDSVPEVNFTIAWPYEAESGKHLLYLLSIEDGRYVQCYPKPGWVNMLASQFKGETKTKEILVAKNRTRRDVVDTKKNKTLNDKQQVIDRPDNILDCRNGTARCIQIPCSARNLKAGDTVNVVLNARIWNGTLLEDYKDQVVTVFSHARIDDLSSYVKDNDDSNHEAQAETRFFPTTRKTTKKSIEVWVIVVAAIAGVVLLVILIVIFKMCGFFNRMETSQYDSVPAN